MEYFQDNYLHSRPALLFPQPIEYCMHNYLDLIASPVYGRTEPTNGHIYIEYDKAIGLG